MATLCRPRIRAGFRLRYSLRRAAIFCFIVFFGGGNAWAKDLVWFCPNDSKLISSSEYDAQWPRARSRVQVYKFYYQVIRDSPVAELRDKFRWLAAHHIATSVEWPAMTWAENGTGYNVEGFNPAETSQKLARKIQSAGGTLDYAAMDEPLFFGHFDKGPHSAQWPVATIAANVAANMQQVWAIFPQCRVGDIEPIDAMPPQEYLSSTTQWIQAFQTATGRPLAFLHDDVLWDNGWRQSVPPISALLTARKIDFGVIFNATGGPGPDARWVESAEVNVQNYNAAHVPKPNHVIFQTWYPYPTAILPETSTTAFSSLVNYYFSPYATQTPPVPFVRLYNASLGRHVYTADARRAAALKSRGWVLEPPTGSVYQQPGGALGLTPLYRLSDGNRDEALTTQATEKANLLASGYQEAGIAGYVFDAANPAGQLLYHAVSPPLGNFYTCNKAEYDALKTPTWTPCGVTCAMP